MNKKEGFTLIELLAVIIILGVLLLVAIPSVTTYINNSRKETYITTAKNFITGAVNLVNSGKLDIFDTNTTYYIPNKCIDLETGGTSPFGEFDPAYIVVTYNNETFNYYWSSRDTSAQGIKGPTPSDKLEPSLIKTGLKKDDVTANTAIGERDRIMLLSETNCESFEEQQIKRRVKENGAELTPNELYNTYMEENSSSLTGLDNFGNANVVQFLQNAINSGYAGSEEERIEHDKKILEKIGKYIINNMTYSELNAYNTNNQPNYYSQYKQIFIYKYDGASRLCFNDSWDGMHVLITAGGYTHVPTTNPSSQFYTNYPMFFGDDTFGTNKEYYIELKVTHTNNTIKTASLRLGRKSGGIIYTVDV